MIEKLAQNWLARLLLLYTEIAIVAFILWAITGSDNAVAVAAICHLFTKLSMAQADIAKLQ